MTGKKLTLAHDLIDLAVLLATDKLFVLVGELDLDPHLILTAHDEGNLVDYGHGGLDGVVGSVDGESQVIETHFRLRVSTDVREHRANFGGRRGTKATLRRVGHDNPP